MKNIIYILFFFALMNLNANYLSMYDIDPTDYPVVKAKFYAYDYGGNRILDFDKSEFNVFENDRQREIIDITCPDGKGPARISSVLTLDISSSMTQGVPNIELAKECAKLWIKSMPLERSECAVTSFENVSYLNSDFTKDITDLRLAVDDLEPWGETNFDAALTDPNAGALNIAKNGKYKRVVVFLTDGKDEIEDRDAIIDLANRNNIEIHTLTIGLPCPDDLKYVSEKTGGKWFENLQDKQQAKSYYLQVLSEVQELEPCYVSWMSEGCELYKDVEVSIKDMEYEYKDNYTIPFSMLPSLTYDPSMSLRFGKVSPGASDTLNVQMTATNNDIFINSMESLDNAFSIVDYDGPKPPFNLPEGEIRNLKVSFTPGDPEFKIAKIKITSDACNGNVIFCSGGSVLSKDESNLKLIEPNGGEEYLVGIDTLIRWEGSLPDEVVMLEYSTNSGTSWKMITDTATGFEHKWAIPDQPSRNCIMRIKQNIKDLSNQYYGKIGNGTLASVFYRKNASPSLYQSIYAIGGGGIHQIGGSSGTISNSFLDTSGYFKSYTQTEDGKIYILTNRNNILRVGDDLNQIERNYNTHNYNFEKIKITEGGELLFGMAKDSLVIYEIEQERKIHVIQLDNFIFSDFEYITNTDDLYAVSEQGKLGILDISSGDLVNEVNFFGDKINTLALNKSRSILALASNSSITIVNNNIYSTLNTIEVDSLVCELEFSPQDPELLYIGTKKGMVYSININDDSFPAISAELEGSINSMMFDSDGRYLIASSNEGSVARINSTNNNTIFNVKLFNSPYYKIDISDNRDLLAAACGRYVQINDLKNNKKITEFNAHRKKINDVIFKKNQSVLITSSEDMSIKTWSLNSYENYYSIYTLGNKTLELLDNHKVNEFISGGSNNKIVRWNLNLGSMLEQMLSHQNDINDLAYTQYGDFIASASSDNSIKLWSNNSGSLVNKPAGLPAMLRLLHKRFERRAARTGSPSPPAPAWR